MAPSSSTLDGVKDFRKIKDTISCAAGPLGVSVYDSHLCITEMQTRIRNVY